MKPQVLMAVAPRQREEIFTEDALSKLELLANVTYQHTDSMTEEELAEAIPPYQCLVTCWGSPRVGPKVVEAARSLRLISHSAGSIRPYICDEVFERGIAVTNSASAIAVSVAETTLGLILATLRRLCQYNEHLRGGRQGRPDLGPMHELRGRRVGVVGMGKVGRRFIALLKPFDCEILVYDPYMAEAEIRKAGGIPTQLTDLVSKCDVLSLHAPNIPKNRHMISRELLETLPQGALLVNTARGELIDEAAMVELANAGRIRLALDVFEDDAAAVAQRLENAKDVILTPHIAGQSVEARRRQGDVTVEDIRLFFSGETPRNLVTKELLGWMA